MIRQLHALTLRGIDDEGAGQWRTVPVAISGSHLDAPETASVQGNMAPFTTVVAQAVDESLIRYLQWTAGSDTTT